MSKSFILIFFVLFTSCASKVKGHYANYHSNNHPHSLPIRAFIDEKYSTQYFKVVNIHFENMMDDWIEIDSARVISLNKKKPMNILPSSDAMLWKEDFFNSNQIDQHNEQIGKAAGYGALAILGIAGTIGGNSGAMDASLGIMQIAAAADATGEIIEHANNLENSKLELKNHLGEKTKLVPGMIQRRWVLVQVKKDQKLCSIGFEINYKRYKRVEYSANLCET